MRKTLDKITKINLSHLIMLVLALGIFSADRLLAADEVVVDEAIEAQVIEISDKLRCPSCQGLSVKESESDISLSMKAKIRSLLKEGKSEQQVLDFFEDRYGEWILRYPKIEGLSYSLWLVPLGFIALGLLIVIFFARRQIVKD